jgi:predicted ribosome quality control (RQC) complex YloA/Tae2 family protein
MVKQRFTSADVAAEVACVRQRCLGMRVANLYDINPKTYVIKLARSGEDSDKVLLLVESGMRFHMIEVGGGLGATR